MEYFSLFIAQGFSQNLLPYINLLHILLFPNLSLRLTSEFPVTRLLYLIYPSSHYTPLGCRCKKLHSDDQVIYRGLLLLGEIFHPVHPDPSLAS